MCIRDSLQGARRGFLENKSIKLVASETANWKIDEAYQATQHMFDQHPVSYTHLDVYKRQDDTHWVRQVLQEHIEGQRERFQADYRLCNRNGHYLWVHDRGRVCERDAQGTPTRLVGMVHNITDQKLNELVLQNQASHDPLTGLLNRCLLYTSRCV